MYFPLILVNGKLSNKKNVKNIALVSKKVFFLSIYFILQTDFLSTFEPLFFFYNKCALFLESRCLLGMRRITNNGATHVYRGSSPISSSSCAPLARIICLVSYSFTPSLFLTCVQAAWCLSRKWVNLQLLPHVEGAPIKWHFAKRCSTSLWFPSEISQTLS